MSGKIDHGSPVPQGDYLPAQRHGGLIFTSGMTPRVDGVMKFHGPVRKDDSIETWRDAVTLACSNALFAVRAMLTGEEKIAAILSLTVFVAAEDGFTAHAGLADFASQFLTSALGAVGHCSRCAVGVATLPGGAPVEIQLVAAI